MKIYILENEPENYRWLEYIGNWFDFFHGLNLTAKPLGTCEHVIRCKPIRDKKERVLGDYPFFLFRLSVREQKMYWSRILAIMLKFSL